MINNSHTTLDLKEGNGGVYKYLHTLKAKKGKYTIKCNTNATVREYWVGTGLGDGTDSIMINSGDCIEYETIYIVNDPEDNEKLKLDMVNRGVKQTEVVNQTGEVLQLWDDGTKVKVLKNHEKFVIKSDPEDAKDHKYRVEIIGSSTPIPDEAISNAQIAKAQRICVSIPEKKMKLDMVLRNFYLTEMRNKTDNDIRLTHRKGEASDGSADARGSDLVNISPKCERTINYDPKKGHTYWVECGEQKLSIEPEDFKEFKRIDVVKNSSTDPGKLELEKLEARPYMDEGKSGFFSKFLRIFGL